MELKSLFINKSFFKKNNLSVKTQENYFIDNFNKSYLNEGYGFFLQSLKSVSNVKLAIGVRDALNILKSQNFHIVVIDLKAIIESIKKSELLLTFLKERNNKVILYCSYDGNFSKSTNINNICNYMNISAIYVTNLLKDFSEYHINKNFLHKLKPTYLGLGKTNISYNHKKHFFDLDLMAPISSKKYDAFFIGSVNKKKRLRSSFLDQIRTDTRVQNYKIYVEKYNKNDSHSIFNNINMIKSSTLSIDLSGQIDNLSMRFHEILLFDGIPLTDKGFLKFHLSNMYSEIINYITFNDMNQFFYLIKIYQSNNFRNFILKKISKIFSGYYDPFRHGNLIIKDLNL